MQKQLLFFQTFIFRNCSLHTSVLSKLSMDKAMASVTDVPQEAFLFRNIANIPS